MIRRRRTRRIPVEELARLRKENARLKVERDILKAAKALFDREEGGK